MKEEAKSNYKKIQGDSFNEKDPIFVMLSAETTPLITLEGLNKSYKQQLEEMYPLHCQSCGSKDLTRASSKEEKEEEGKETTENKQTPLDTAVATANILTKKNKYKVED